MAHQDQQLTDNYATEAAPLATAITRAAHGDRQLAEDISQESWLRAVLYWPTHGVPDRPGAWLRTVSRNLLFNERRRRRAVPLDQLPEESLPSESHEHATDTAEQLALLHAAIAELPLDARQLIEMHYFAGQSFAEIGRSIGISERAVEGKLRRIRIRLRAELEGRGVTSADLRGVAAATDLSVLSFVKGILMSGVLTLLLSPLLMLLAVYAITRRLAARRVAWLHGRGGFSEESAVPAQITPAMLDVGFKRALICMVAIVAVMGLGSYAVASVTDRPLSWARGVVGATGYGFTLTLFLGLWLRGRATRGSIILDCGPNPARWVFRLCAIFALQLCVSVLLDDSPVHSVLRVGGLPLMLLHLIFFAVLGFGRLEVTERGLWQYWGLLPWEKIGSASWTPESTLLLQARGRFPSLSKGVVPVPPAHRAVVAELLAQHGVTTTA